MSKKTKTRAKKKVRYRPPSTVRSETPAVEALTVFWTLSVVMVAIVDVLAAMTRIYANWQVDAPRVALLSGMLFLSATVLGILALALLPVVLRLRRDKPPRALIVFAVVVSAAPLAVFALQAIA